MAELSTQRVRPAYGGWNTEVAPDYLGDSQSPFIENFLCRPGKLVMRGPTGNSYDLSYAATEQTSYGQQVFDDRILLDQFHPIGGHTAKHINTTTGVVTAVVVPANQQFFGARYAQIGGFTYSFQAAGSLQLMKWAGGAVFPTAIAAAVAPISVTGASDLIVHAERLFVGSCTLGGVGSRHHIYYSDVGGPAAGALTDWQDDVTGLNNAIVIGNNTTSTDDTFVGFGRVGRDLAIFKSRSVWLLTGTGSTSFAVRRFSDTIGCLDSNSICSINDVCYFASDQGLMMFDGARIVSVSDDIRTTLIAALLPAHVTAGLIYCEYIGAGLLMLISTSQSNNGTTVTTTGRFAGIYDTSTRVWTSFRCYASTGAPCALIRAYGQTLVFNGRNVYQVDTVSQPAPTDGAVRTPPDGIDTILTSTQPMLAQFWTRMIKLSSPANRSQLHRILMDHRFKFDDGSIDATAANSWDVSVLSGTGGGPLDSYSVPAMGETTSYLVRRRDSHDIFSECTDLQLRISSPNVSTPVYSGELYDITVEFQNTHQRSSA